MKIIIKAKRIIATASDAYTGPDEFMQVPEGFDPARLERYRTEQWVESPFEDSPPAVPVSITPRQGLTMLSRAGALAQVLQALDAMEGQGGEEARIDFERATEWRRDWPLLNNMAALLGLSSDQVDQMFVSAATL